MIHGKWKCFNEKDKTMKIIYIEKDKDGKINCPFQVMVEDWDYTQMCGCEGMGSMPYHKLDHDSGMCPMFYDETDDEDFRIEIPEWCPVRKYKGIKVIERINNENSSK